MVARQQTMYQIGFNQSQKQKQNPIMVANQQTSPLDYLNQPDPPNQSGEIGSIISYLDTLAYQIDTV